MPLPKPTTTVSKRRQHSETLLPLCHQPFIAASTQIPSLQSKLYPHTPLHKRRLRVVCTDPDATDDSSGDEMETATVTNKRLMHEVLLPLPLPLLHHPICPRSAGPRGRQPGLKHNALASYCRKPRCNTRKIKEILVSSGAAHVSSDGNVHRSTPCDHAMMTMDAKKNTTAEEFLQFLSESAMDELQNEWNAVTDCGAGLGLLHEDEMLDIPDYQLDLEALAWINSLENLP